MYCAEVIEFFQICLRDGYPILFPPGTGSEVGEHVELVAPLNTTGALVTNEWAVRLAHAAQAALPDRRSHNSNMDTPPGILKKT